LPILPIPSTHKYYTPTATTLNIYINIVKHLPHLYPQRPGLHLKTQHIHKNNSRRPSLTLFTKHHLNGLAQGLKYLQYTSEAKSPRENAWNMALEPSDYIKNQVVSKTAVNCQNEKAHATVNQWLYEYLSKWNKRAGGARTTWLH